MADRDGQAGLGREGGAFGLPEPDPVAVGATGVGVHQQSCGVGVAGFADVLPPAS